MKRHIRTILLCTGILIGILMESTVFAQETGQGNTPAKETAAAEAGSAGEEEKAACRIACIGDSITYGYGFEIPWEESYPAILQELLGDEYEVFSYSGNGYALTDAGINFFETEEYYWSLKSNADLYVIMMGSNDSYMMPWDPERFREVLLKLLKDYEEASPDCKFILAAPPHDFAMEIFVPEAGEIYTEMVEIFRETAEERGDAYLDLFAATDERPELYQEDMVHPNAEGQQLIAELLRDVIVEME